MDFSLQLSLDKNSEQVESNIFEWLKVIANKVAEDNLSPLGALVVFGDFEKNNAIVDGMVQMKPKQNPIESYISVNGVDIEEHMVEFSVAPYDGAIIVNRSGQVIGAGIYLVVDNPMLDMPDDCGTRHKAAASFSERNDVISVLTLSEETNTVRVWKDGKTKNPTGYFRLSARQVLAKQLAWLNWRP